MPASGSTSAIDCTTPPATFGDAALRRSCPIWSRSESHAVATMRGALKIIIPKMSSRTGMRKSTQPAVTPRTQGFSSSTFVSVSLPGSALFSVGLIRVNMSGTPVRSLRM